MLGLKSQFLGQNLFFTLMSEMTNDSDMTAYGFVTPSHELRGAENSFWISSTLVISCHWIIALLHIFAETKIYKDLKIK